MNPWYNLLSKNQRDNIYKSRRRQLGKYFALWTEGSNLKKYMITLSPTTNSLDKTIELRKDFLKKLNNFKYAKGKQLLYFSAIEIGLNKNSPSSQAEAMEQLRMNTMQYNFHIHIQLFTDMTAKELQSIMSKIDPNLCVYNMLTKSQNKHARYDYVVKDLKALDFQLQYIIRTQFKGKMIYTSSHKKVANYMITKLWGYMRRTYRNKWAEKIKDKYFFMLNLKKRGDLILANTNTSNVTMNYDSLYIKQKGIYIHIKKNLL